MMMDRASMPNGPLNSFEHVLLLLSLLIKTNNTLAFSRRRRHTIVNYPYGVMDTHVGDKDTLRPVCWLSVAYRKALRISGENDEDL